MLSQAAPSAAERGAPSTEFVRRRSCDAVSPISSLAHGARCSPLPSAVSLPSTSLRPFILYSCPRPGLNVSDIIRAAMRPLNVGRSWSWMRLRCLRDGWPLVISADRTGWLRRLLPSQPHHQ